MKEFESQTGGRYTYVDDIKNLQDLALAFSSIFDPDDNFVISGCTVSGNRLTTGFVWLGGKIRSFAETAWSAGAKYIYEVNSVENVTYASGDPKLGRKIYGCALGTSAPAGVSSIAFDAKGNARRLREAFFGKYALLLESTKSTQEVNTPVSFNKTLTAGKAITSKGSVGVSVGNVKGSMGVTGNTFYLQSQMAGGKTFRLSFSDNDGFLFMINGAAKFRFNASEAYFAVPVHSSKVTSGNVVITGSSVYDSGTNSDEGVLNINMVGRSGGKDFFRSTKIGDGKGNVMMECNGKSGTVKVFYPTTFNTKEGIGVTLKGSLKKNDVAMLNMVLWQDSEGADCAKLGYISDKDSAFTVANLIGDIVLSGLEAVNIGPAIKENGTLLSDKYVSKSAYNTAIAQKANTSSVYTKTDANATFATKNGGFSQFVTTTNTKDVLCNSIGAAKASSLTSYATLANKLSDMAASEEDKKTIRDNIGAAAASDVEKVNDTGWVQITDVNGGKKLFARQIGDIVCIQGSLTTMHSGIAFTLPASIVAPKYDISASFRTPGGGPWSCKILAGQKNCEVVYCDDHNQTVYISMTYMI